MGAGGSVNDGAIDAAVKGVVGGEIPGLEIGILKPYLQHFLRMRKTGIPLGACEQAAKAKLQGDGLDPACLKPLETFLEKVGEQKESKHDCDWTGPQAEELLQAFGMTEQELKNSMSTAKTNLQSFSTLGFKRVSDYEDFQERYAGYSCEEALQRATDDGASEKQIKCLKANYEAQAKYATLDEKNHSARDQLYLEEAEAKYGREDERLLSGGNEKK
jgi:hypothetical protein